MSGEGHGEDERARQPPGSVRASLPGFLAKRRALLIDTESRKNKLDFL
jgi:hypothetical protein